MKRSRPPPIEVGVDDGTNQHPEIRVVGSGTRGDGELNPDSPTWLFIQAWANRQILEARERNDVPQAEVETALLRGGIALLKKLLSLPDVSAKQGLLEKAQESGSEGRWEDYYIDKR